MDWFLPVEAVANRTGSWYVGVLAVTSASVPGAGLGLSSVVRSGVSCSAQPKPITSAMLDTDFGVDTYTIRVVTGGAYAFNTTTQVRTIILCSSSLDPLYYGNGCEQHLANHKRSCVLPESSKSMSVYCFSPLVIIFRLPSFILEFF